MYPTGIAAEAGYPPITASSVLSHWLRTPLYMTRWTYFHRPGVWNAVGGREGLTWHGLYGFKTLFAGAGGISYTGGPRAIPHGMRWILRGGGAGMEAMGRGFAGMDPILSRLGGYLWRPMPAGLPLGYATNIPSAQGLMYRFGRGVGRFGAGFRTGGMAGAIRGVGAARLGTITEQIFGGAVTPLGRFRIPTGGDPSLLYTLVQGRAMFPTYGAAREAIGGLEAAVGRGIRGVRIGGLVRPGRYSRQILQGLSPEQLRLFQQTGRVGATALTRGIMWRGGAQLMRAGTVGLNIALFGSMLASLAYTGTRAAGEAMWNFRMNQRIPALEFGRGISPFPEVGSLTERQRAIQQIQASPLNARSFMGSEGRLMHDTRI